MSKAQQLAERLKRYIPNGDGYSSEFANFLAEVVEYLSQDEQEPVAWASPNVIPLRGLKDNHSCILTAFKCEANTVALYTAPPKRKPLSTEQIRDLLRQADTGLYFARLIEKSHGIGE